MPDPIDDARKLIQSRLAEIEAEATQLERALASLEEGSSRRDRRIGRSSRRAGTPTSSQPKPKHSPTPRRRRTRRAARGQRRDELLAAIKTTPGARPSELARSIGVNPPQVHALIAKARAEKLIVKKGGGYNLSARTTT